MQDFSTRPWFSYLNPNLQALVKNVERLASFHTNYPEEFTDYSFLVFPMAKAYEGFLKKYLLDLDLISQETYQSRRFRIGRAINPDVRFNQRDEFWLFDDLARSCGEEKARLFWETWLKCRNQVFHYFPKESFQMSFSEAIDKLNMMDQAMSEASICYEKVQARKTQQEFV